MFLYYRTILESYYRTAEPYTLNALGLHIHLYIPSEVNKNLGSQTSISYSSLHVKLLHQGPCRVCVSVCVTVFPL